MHNMSKKTNVSSFSSVGRSEENSLPLQTLFQSNWNKTFPKQFKMFLVVHVNHWKWKWKPVQLKTSINKKPTGQLFWRYNCISNELDHTTLQMWKFHLPNVWKTIKYIVGSDLSNIKTMDRKSNHSRSGVLLTAKSKKNTIQIPVPLQIKNLYMMTRYRVFFSSLVPP